MDFGITINHYIELDFKSFKGIVDAVGGVPMSFQTPMRDRASGLYVYFFAGSVPGDFAGCTTLRSKLPPLSTKNTQSEALSQVVVCR